MPKVVVTTKNETKLRDYLKRNDSKTINSVNRNDKSGSQADKKLLPQRRGK